MTHAASSNAVGHASLSHFLQGLPGIEASWNWMRGVATGVAGMLVARPLAQLYLHGPRQLGFWGGSEEADICAHLTGSPADFWRSSLDTEQECAARIRRDFEGWYTLVMVGLYFAGGIGILVHFCHGRRPVHIQVLAPPPYSTGKNEGTTAD